MKKLKFNTIKELKTFLILWSTQSLSQLGSALTSFALILWLYEHTGSALQTALLSICSYTPYVIMSIFAGALSDRWDKKKVMLICDSLAAISTIIIFMLIKEEMLCPWHLYFFNGVNGIMNTVQQPASDVAMTLIIPEEHYQKTSGLRYFSQSLVTILNPMIATALYSFGGMEAVIFVDISTFLIAFFILCFFIKIPAVKSAGNDEAESLKTSVKGGIQFLRDNKLILTLILFLAGVNFVASAYNAVLPAYVLSSPKGGEKMFGILMSTAGIATLVGSVFATILKKPKNRIFVIYITMLISLSVGNFIRAFSREPVLWCVSQIIGWLPVPIMGSNLDVILRSSIPVEMQGRVYSCRNTLQFFTIPIGFLAGGFMVDEVCEPIMKRAVEGGLLQNLFGQSKGSGAAMVMFIIGVVGTAICLIFRKILKKYKY